MNGCWILSNASSASIEMIVWFCHCICWCGVSNWLICICWMILVTLGWIHLDYSVWSFLCVAGFSLLMFFWEFLHLYSSKIWSVIFYFGIVFVGFWHQGDGGFIEWLWECSLLFNLSEKFEKDWYTFFLHVWQNSPVKPSSPGLLFPGSFLNYRFYFTSSDQFVQNICFFLIQFWWAVRFRNLSISYRLPNLL